ncbi:hypothetical protein SCUCBS95973_001323, partial [Sporothrix curviconia]
MILAYRYIKKKRQEKRAQDEQAEARRQQSTATSGLAGDIDGVPVGRNGVVAGVPIREQAVEPLQADGTFGNTPAQETKEAKEAKPELTPEQKAERKRRYIYRCKIIFGLMMPFTLQGLDTTIVASALPYIATDF